MSSNYFFTQSVSGVTQVIPFDDIFARSGPFTEGNLWVWGKNNDIPRLGINIANSIILTPVTTFAGGANWKQISSRSNFTAAIKTDGTLWTWGHNNNGPLGINNTLTRSTPVTTFAGGNNWKQVSAGYQHCSAIKTDGTLWIWGNNSDGQLGINQSGNLISTPVTTFIGGTNWKKISCGDNHTAAIKTDGTLWLWGDNTFGQLGINRIENPVSLTNKILTPITTFAGGNNWENVSCGSYYTGAIKKDGTLWVWGDNFKSQLGKNLSYFDCNNIIRTPITTFGGGINWNLVSTKSAIKNNGTLWLWGNGSSGELGNNSQYKSLTPVTTFLGDNTWKQIERSRIKYNGNFSGFPFSVAVKRDGTLWVWGNNAQGQLGINASGLDKFTPVTTFSGGTNWKQVSVGYGHAAAIKTDGTLWTWGNNFNGQLGTNSSVSRSTPVTTFAGGTNWKQVSCGFYHVAAIKNDGTLWVWGSNGRGKLGNNAQMVLGLFDPVLTPITTFAGGNNWKQVSCGDEHTAAIKTDGTLWVWGNEEKLGVNYYHNPFVSYESSIITPITTFLGGNTWNEVSCGIDNTLATKNDGTLWVWGTNTPNLGANLIEDLYYNPSVDDPYIPSFVRITPITTFAGGNTWKLSDISYGEVSTHPAGKHVAAIKTDGSLWLWGSGVQGQLGNNLGGSLFICTPITTFAGGNNWKQVSLGGDHSAAIKTDGSLWVWGVNAEGLLGINIGPLQFTRSTPVTTFAGGTNWRQVACAEKSIAAIKNDGTLWTWGYNANGTVGINTTVSMSTPVTTFAGGSNWKQVSCGNEHVAAIKDDGTLWTWGLNNNYQLGIDGDVRSRSTPVTTFAGGNDWRQVSCGNYHTSAIKNDGSLWIWGAGNQGQLGISNSDFTERKTPVTTFSGGYNWTQVRAGNYHTLAIKNDGTLWTWGYNFNGELGDNTAIKRGTPITTFSGESTWKQVAAGYYRSVAVKNDGTLWSWGLSGNGALGINAFRDKSTPVTTFAGGTNWRQEGDYQFSIATCDVSSALKNDGTLWTWGYLYSGSLGNNLEPEILNNSATPITTFVGGNNWNSITLGSYSSIGIKQDGTLWAWGKLNSLPDPYPVILQSTNSYYKTPVQSNTGNTWKQVACGYDHFMALKTDGTLWGWGSAYDGGLGNNDQYNSKITPVTTFLGKSDWKQVSCGNNTTFALNYIDTVL